MARVLPSGVSLANLDLLMRSLEFIEDHLEDTVAVQTEDIAAACYASKSALEKLFKYTIRFSVHDYIIAMGTIKRFRCLPAFIFKIPELF